jgi:hydrogenase maturation protease
MKEKLLVSKTVTVETEKNHKTLVLGIGNPILRDDRVGHLLLQILRGRISSPDIVFQETSLAGLDLAEFFVGFKSAVVIDAIQSGGTPGAVYCLKPEDFAVRLNRSDLHRIGLLQALELGKSLGWPMPQDVTIVAVEAGDAGSFGDDLTPEVAKAIPVALEKIENLLSDHLG